MKRAFSLWAVQGVAVAALLGLPVHAAEVDYWREVFPALKANCIACHNKTTTKAKLNMETPALMAKGGDSGPGLVPGKSAESLIAQAAAHQEDMVMPPKNNKSGAVDLTAREQELLRLWIDQGAKAADRQPAREVTWQAQAPEVNPIYTVALTGDGRYAACGRGRHLAIYDLATRRLAGQAGEPGAGAHRAPVQALAFSPDGQRLASGSFREVKIWRRESAPALLRQPATPAVATALSADGRRQVSANAAGNLQVLEPATGKLLKTMGLGGACTVQRLAVSDDGLLAVIATAEGRLGLWDLESGTELAAREKQTGIRALVWLPEFQGFATGGDDKLVRLWALPCDCSTDFNEPLELKGATGAITAVAPLGKGERMLAASADGKVRLYESHGARLVREYTAGGVAVLAVSGDGAYFAAGGADGVVRLWQTETGKVAGEIRATLPALQRVAELEQTVARRGLDETWQLAEVARIGVQEKALDELLKKANETIATQKKALPEKEKLVAPATAAREAAQKTYDELAAQEKAAATKDAALTKKVTDAHTALATATMAERSAQAAFAAVQNNIEDATADVERITKAKADNARLTATATAAAAAAKKEAAEATTALAAAKQALAKGSGQTVAALAFAKDGSTLAALAGDRTLNVWSTAAHQPLEQVPAGTGSDKPGALLARADGTYLSASAAGAVAATTSAPKWVLERTFGDGTHAAPFADRVNALAFSPDGQLLATGTGEPSRSGDVALWEIATGKQRRAWPELHRDAVLALSFSPDGKALATGAADKLGRVLDVASGKVTFTLEGHTHHVMGVAFRADARVLATAGGDGAVLIWDLHSGERKKKIEGWTKEITSIQFIGATPQLLTSAGDKRLRIVRDDGAEVRAMANLPDFMQAAASTATASLVIGGGEDSRLRVWDGTTGAELASFDAK